MKSIISIRNISKKYRLGLVHEDFLAEKVFSNVKKLFSRDASQRKAKNNGPEEIWALKDVSFDVKPGEIVGIIGRNGAGKSTLLKILSDITEPTEGEIRLRGRVSSLLEVGTGFHPELTGRENVYLNGAIMGMRRAEITRKFDEIVNFAEVDKFVDTPVKRYSSGMYVRLAFAVAAHLEPDILLVDEVLAVGDVAFQKKCLGKMDNVASEGRTVLFVSHNMGVIGKLCKTAIQLEEGRVVNSGNTGEVIATYLQGMNIGSEAETSFAEDKIKTVCIRKIRILDHDDNPVTILDRAKPFRIEITYQVYEKIKDAYVVFTLNTIDNIVRICTNKENDTFANGIHIKEPGTYASTVEFPGGMLNVGFYYANTGIVSTSRKTIDKADTPQFELIDCGDVGNYQTSLPQHKRGLLALPLKWNIERVR